MIAANLYASNGYKVIFPCRKGPLSVTNRQVTGPLAKTGNSHVSSLSGLGKVGLEFRDHGIVVFGRRSAE
jgi:hypothetical protein